MKYLDGLAWVTILIALFVAVYSLIRLSSLPDVRDHRPMAPVVALALAYLLMQLQAVFNVPELMPGVRKIAWLLWHGCALLQMGFLVHLHTRCRCWIDRPPNSEALDTKKPLM